MVSRLEHKTNQMAATIRDMEDGSVSSSPIYLIPLRRCIVLFVNFDIDEGFTVCGRKYLVFICLLEVLEG